MAKNEDQNWPLTHVKHHLAPHPRREHPARDQPARGFISRARPPRVATIKRFQDRF